MVKKMLLTMMAFGILSSTAHGEINQNNQSKYQYGKNLSDGYVIPAFTTQNKLSFFLETLNDKNYYYNDGTESAKRAKQALAKVFKTDPNLNKMFELYAKPTLLSQNTSIINIFDDGSGKSDFITKRNIEKVTPKIEEYAKDYASKVFVHVATRGADGEIVYMTPQQRKDFIHSAYMAGAMKLDNETVAKLDGKYPLEVEDVAQIRNGICIALKRRDLLKHLNGCDVNKPLTTQDYVKSGATRLAIEWGTNGKTAISADSRMKGVSIQKTIRVDPRVLDKLLNSK